ncbi:hypothetical protein SARC_02421 [Sphaeroforma arctica JP610]|uniref:Diphthine--ammonia ligase n=1 Tax=Sphaeroforma arctica JP610 TaxID=667725 RepID=A0A0L0G8M3_9EUKA|nr:hypothetical protein SARC_02421 [Sphaeroforma arctica JP610]KNC85387.1 hypothetical protein SARC_02421 [Sphaeroforma arctica JP610]|eukprot:XP_014159289.1 hypothetical protein SARC_02421 [Sphaeroforma arctica JP610]
MTRIVEAQKLNVEARTTAISWTGGKDCNLSLLHAWREPSLRVTALVVFRPEGAVFKAHPLSFMQAQADSLQLPLIHAMLPKDPACYKLAYADTIKKLHADHGIETIVTGDMDLVGDQTRNFITECAEMAEIGVWLPLWQAGRLRCLETLIAEKFEVVFSCVKSPWFDGRWIGRSLSPEIVREMEQMALKPPEGSPDSKPLDLGGERGEYHTMCINGPLYHDRVTTQSTESNELIEQRGQKEGERWWTIGV